MSQFGSVSTTHRAEVHVPEDVFRRFGHTKEYERVVYAAGAMVAASGQDSYSGVVEWGEDPVMARCADFVNYWHNWILQWQGIMRSEA